MATDWFSLQNGSDIRGVASEGIPDQPITLTPDVVARIAQSFTVWLAAKENVSPAGLRIALGRDSRISGPLLLEAASNGIAAAGAVSLDCGLASTPALFMATQFDTAACHGAIMLTASHLPFNRNGMKFFSRGGGLDKPDITRLIEQASVLPVPSPAAPPDYFNLMDLYSRFLVDRIRTGVQHKTHYLTPLAGFRIVVDAGNGAGGFFVDKVLKPLGADTTGSRFLDPDGRFPNHIPNPEDETAMAFIRDSVLQNKADLGIIFDTDVDRAAAVDDQGTGINRNRLIGLISAIILEEHPGSVIVTDSVTSDGLTRFIQDSLGGVHHRFKRGYKNVINECIRLNRVGQESWLAVETSGHAALRENHYLDDGAFLMVKILIKMAQLRQLGGKLSGLTANLKMPAESEEFRIRLKEANYHDQGKRILERLEEFINQQPGWARVPDTYEGIRVSVAPEAGSGWFLIRLSLHDPVLPLNIESEIAGGVRTIAGSLLPFLRSQESVEFSLPV